MRLTLTLHEFARTFYRMISTSNRCLFCLLLLCAGVTVRGELVLSNYNAGNPLQIMPAGDSITDDVVVQGAWRKPLQPLLETNGFPFTFVGRQTSTAAPGFTKLKHEGYGGAVVAAPGLLGAHQYSPELNYLQYIVPQALTNAIPDVMLILIGANDISNGRNPFVVATNHLATLLDSIFSNAPNVHVILAKATRQENFNATTGTNIPIYNAALQMVVNQRRALGQKVCLADFYSVVDYPLMMFSDGLHPNNNGLQAIANEWLARLQTITLRTDLVTTVLMNGGAAWKYNDKGQDLGTDWAQTVYDDSGWSNGVARLGYGDSVAATTLSYGPQANNKYVTTYFRRPFVVPQNMVITNLNLRVAQSDGAIVYLNGQEIYRTNLPAGQITYTRLATAAVSLNYYRRFIFYPTNIPVNLTAGTNWIAAEVHLSNVTKLTANGGMGFDLELIGTGYPISPPSLSIAWAGDNRIALNWPLSYGSNFSLYSTTDLTATGSWTLAPGSIQTNGGQTAITQSLDSSAKFFRLQQP